MDYFSGLDSSCLQITCSSRKWKAKNLQHVGGNTLTSLDHGTNNVSGTMFWEGLNPLSPKIKSPLPPLSLVGSQKFLTHSPMVRFLTEVQLGLNSTLLILLKTYTGIKQILYESLLYDKGEGLAK